MTLCMGASGATAAPIDCGLAPTVKCLADAIFALAKTLPEDNSSRGQFGFAERELLPGSSKTAVEFVIWDNPDPSPWDDIYWIAEAGRFDRAIELANRATSPVARLGGLLAVAIHMLDKNQIARATKIADEVERKLSSLQADADSDDYAALLPHTVAEVRVRLGQHDRALRLLAGGGVASVNTLLELARKYPAAASLREQAWREAERLNDPYAWQLLLDDALSGGDQLEASRAGQRVGIAMEGKTEGLIRIRRSRWRKLR